MNYNKLNIINLKKVISIGLHTMLNRSSTLKRLNNFPSIKDKSIIDNKLRCSIFFEKVNMDGLEEMHKYSSNPKLYEFLEYDVFEKLSQTKKYLKNLITKMHNKEGPLNFSWFVKRKNDNKLIGSASLVNLNVFRKSVEQGYAIDPEEWGKGYVLEIEEILKYLTFEILDLNRIGGMTSIKNEPTINTIIASGMLKEGVLKDYYFINGHYHDGYQYGMTKEMYNKQKKQINIKINTDEVLEKVIKLVSEVFPEEKIKADSKMSEILEWDSLGHINVIMSLKEKLNVNFSPSEITAAISIKKIVEIIKDKNS